MTTLADVHATTTPGHRAQAATRLIDQHQRDIARRPGRVADQARPSHVHRPIVVMDGSVDLCPCGELVNR